MALLINAMIIAGALLMVYNIIRYHSFIGKMAWMQNSQRDKHALYLPLVFLILFLIGYLLVAFIGEPDLLVAGILLGGSIFVFMITQLLHFIVNKVNRDQRLQEALDEAQRASAAKTAFLSNMSHDIRTPMNAIIGYTQLARRDGITNEEVQNYLEKIDNSSQFLLELINDILEMSRIESGKMEIESARSDLCHIMSHIRNMFAEQMIQKQIDFTVKGENVTNTLVICDEHRLNRVLMNLVSNAYKFTPKGGHVSVVLAQTDLSDEKATYEFRVKDDGIGMKPEFAEKIFEAFERERNSTDSGIQGTGLGMSISKSIVDLMGGTIRINTAPGQGSEFIVTLTFPVVEGSDTVCSASAQSVEGCPISSPDSDDTVPVDFTGKKLLLAEDNEVNREIALIVLHEKRFEVDVAENGQIAVDMVKASAAGYYDAVLMDVQMPVMNGYNATKAIRALEDPELSQIPVIAMTANAFQEDIEFEHEAGMTAHITKPIDVDEMMRVLAEYVK
ncbi:MAG: response regulator [Lachnospiraceae bacterium]|nr:response regulator [Lachnospiraceae bacterium]